MCHFYFMITLAHPYQILSSLEKIKDSLHQKNDEEGRNRLEIKNTLSIDLSLPMCLPKKKVSSANTSVPFLFYDHITHQYQILSSLENTKDSLHQKMTKKGERGSLYLSRFGKGKKTDGLPFTTIAANEVKKCICLQNLGLKPTLYNDNKKDHEALS